MTRPIRRGELLARALRGDVQALIAAEMLSGHSADNRPPPRSPEEALRRARAFVLGLDEPRPLERDVQ